MKSILLPSFFLSLYFLTHLGLTPSLPAAETSLPAGAEKINENSVTASVSFLASDELAGRGTASPEFNIATAYVKSRFVAAGLIPVGDNNTYYHETPYPIRFYPTPDQASLKGSMQPENQPIPILGILGAGLLQVNFQGDLIEIDATKFTEIKSLSRFAVTQWETDAKGQRALSQLTRLANHLQSVGAQGLILRCSSNSEWVRLATELRDSPRTDKSRQIEIPILLISVEQDLPQSVSVSVPPITSQMRVMRNVIAAIPGADPTLSHQAVLYSAHLDHLGKTQLDGDNIYNGADDDASGVTAVLTLADAFAAMPNPPKRTLLFMTYWGEESGLLGSEAFVNRPTWPLKDIIANINIEMIGRPEPGANNKSWVTGWHESDLGHITRQSAHKYGFEIFEHPQYSAMLYKASDNWSFAQKGVVAHSFSAGSLHQDYHQVSDEWERLEIPHMTQVIRGLFAGSMSLIDGSQTPKPIQTP